MLNYKFRLYPTKEQEERLVDTLEANRVVYNYFVLNNFKSRNDMNYALTELKEQQPTLRNYHSKMLQMISTKVAGAWSALEELKKKGYKAGKLQKLGEGECNSFVYNQSGFQIDDDRLYLSKIGCIQIRLHRQPVDVKQVIIVRQAGRWYAIAACAIVRRMVCTLVCRKPVGIDVGITNYAYDSDGNHVDNPLLLTKDLKPLRRAQKRVSRRKPGSNNYKKAVSWLQRLNMRIANKRRNFLHNLSNYYSTRYDLIFVERLRIQNMNKNHHLARHIMDSSWGSFKQMLKYKANCVVEVNPYNTSIRCSKCGHLVQKTLAVRLHECPVCGAVLDRDYNAAGNILCDGLKSLDLPMQHGKVTPAENLDGVGEAGTSPHALFSSGQLTFTKG